MAIAGFRNISELLEIQERGIDPPTLALRIRSSRARSGTPLPVKKGAPVPKKKSELPQIEINADGTPKRKPGRPLKRPGGAAPSTATEFARITLAKEHALAGLRQLEYEQRAGTVVAIDVARRVLFEEAIRPVVPPVWVGAKHSEKSLTPALTRIQKAKSPAG
ncbi:hypothetical protein F3J20_01540 [Paraburkholderia sp. Cy-641]|uniref:hypothetical protein n=1 Tax=Paraburkholderia sp. Cy-641 TaxID=2608337 RepID=UPI001424A7D9|nr:hypothetical protein [Paraburkholderia sp. Cy-641]NIF76090.1 hypothetical protein [Paraburkholderia sp. Cy-641]